MPTVEGPKFLVGSTARTFVKRLMPDNTLQFHDMGKEVQYGFTMIDVMRSIVLRTPDIHYPPIYNADR